MRTWKYRTRLTALCYGRECKQNTSAEECVYKQVKRHKQVQKYTPVPTHSSRDASWYQSNFILLEFRVAVYLCLKHSLKNDNQMAYRYWLSKQSQESTRTPHTGKNTTYRIWHFTQIMSKRDLEVKSYWGVTWSHMTRGLFYSSNVVDCSTLRLVFNYCTNTDVETWDNLLAKPTSPRHVSLCVFPQ